jgi:hypothetical protein
LIESCRHRDPLAGNGGGDAVGSDVANVGLTAAERLDLGLVDVEPQRWKSGFAEDERQRQLDVSLPYNPDALRVCADPRKQLLLHLGVPRERVADASM